MNLSNGNLPQGNMKRSRTLPFWNMTTLTDSIHGAYKYKILCSFLQNSKNYIEKLCEIEN